MAPKPWSRIDWRRLLVESAAILFTILLAFAVDRWWDGKRARQSERGLLSGLLDDFESSRGELDQRLEMARRMAEGNAQLLERVHARERGAVEVPEALVLAVLGGPTYEANTNALDAALAAGEIELLQSRRLRNELANWRRLLRDTTEDEVEVRRITNQQVVPLLSRTVDLKPLYELVLPWSMRDPDAMAHTGSVTIDSSNELIGALALRRFYLDFAVNDLEQLLASLEAIVGIASKALAGA